MAGNSKRSCVSLKGKAPLKETTDSAIKKVSDQLVCSVCREEYSRPRVLPCLHVFCESCLEKLVDMRSILCPNCRRSASLPGSSVSIFPRVFYIQHLFEIREALEMAQNHKKASCSKCGEGEVQAFCADCGQFICSLCHDMHLKWKELQGHQIPSLFEVQEMASKMLTPRKVTMFCTKHSTEPIKLFCETCEEVICRDCTVKTHRYHEYDLIPEVFSKYRNGIVSSLTPLKVELTCLLEQKNYANISLTALKEVHKHFRKETDDDFDKLRAEMEDTFKEYLAKIEASRQECHSLRDQVVIKRRGFLQDKVDGYSLREAEVSSCLEFIEGSMSNSTEVEILSMRKQFQKHVEQVCSEYKPRSEDLPSILFLVENSQQSHNKANLSCFCGIYVLTIRKLNYPCQITCAATGGLLVCQKFSNYVSRSDDSNYKHLRDIPAGGLGGPVGVTVLPNNSILVAFIDQVKEFTPEGDEVSSANVQCEGKFMWNPVLAIAYNPMNDKVYLCRTYFITVLNRDLTLHNSFGRKGSDVGEFNSAEDVSIDKKGNVLVCDFFNNRVQVFNADGRHLFSITHSGVDCKIYQPAAVAVGPDGCVYLIEQSSGRLSVFNENGEYIKSFTVDFMSKAIRHGRSVLSIAINSDRYMHISDHSNVYVFR